MSQRHPIQNDASMLVTTVTRNRAPIFSDPALAHEAIETLLRTQEQYPFFLYGFVIMPDHVHTLLHVPAPSTISKIMNVFKSGCTFDLGISKLWQPRFHIRIAKNRAKALRYIHQNPVRNGLIECAEDYPWSSASGTWDISPLDIP